MGERSPTADTLLYAAVHQREMVWCWEQGRNTKQRGRWLFDTLVSRSEASAIIQMKARAGKPNRSPGMPGLSKNRENTFTFLK